MRAVESMPLIVAQISGQNLSGILDSFKLVSIGLEQEETVLYSSGDALFRLAKTIQDDRLREAARRRQIKAVTIDENGVSRSRSSRWAPKRASAR